MCNGRRSLMYFFQSPPHETMLGAIGYRRGLSGPVCCDVYLLTVCIDITTRQLMEVRLCKANERCEVTVRTVHRISIW